MSERFSRRSPERLRPKNPYDLEQILVGGFSFRPDIGVIELGEEIFEIRNLTESLAPGNSRSYGMRGEEPAWETGLEVESEERRNAADGFWVGYVELTGVPIDTSVRCVVCICPCEQDVDLLDLNIIFLAVNRDGADPANYMRGGFDPSGEAARQLYREIVGQADSHIQTITPEELDADVIVPYYLNIGTTPESSDVPQNRWKGLNGFQARRVVEMLNQSTIYAPGAHNIVPGTTDTPAFRLVHFELIRRHSDWPILIRNDLFDAR